MASPRQIYAETNKGRWLPDNAPLWRYVSLKTLFLYLTGKVFIPSVLKLRDGDPFEGQFTSETEWFNTAMRERYGQQCEAIEDWIRDKLCGTFEKKQIEADFSTWSPIFVCDHYFDFRRTTRFAWCWFHSLTESAAMWKIYGRQGAAVETTVGKLRAMLGKAGRDFVFGRMRYVRLVGGSAVDLHPEAYQEDVALLLHPYFLKREEYQSEDEVRFVTCGPPKNRPGGLVLFAPTPQDWIQRIRLWPGLSASEEAALKAVVEKFIPDAEDGFCQCSELFGMTPYSGEKSSLSAAFAEMGDTRWKEGADEVPPALKELWP